LSGEGSFCDNNFDHHDMHGDMPDMYYDAQCTFWQCYDDETADDAVMCIAEDCWAMDQWGCTIYNIYEDDTYTTMECDTYAIYDREQSGWETDECSQASYECEMWYGVGGYDFQAVCMTTDDCFEPRCQVGYEM